METSLTTLTRPLCRTCRLSSLRTVRITAPVTVIPSRTRASSSKGQPSVIHRRTPSKFASQLPGNSRPGPRNTQVDVRISRVPTAAELKQVQQLADVILKHPSIPSEEDTLTALKAIEQAISKVGGHLKPSDDGASSNDDNTPASALLSLDSRPVPNAPSQQHLPTETIDLLSNTAYQIVVHPSVFITPSLLRTYVSLQTFLQRPSTFPDIFDLYSTKPIPTTSKSSTGVSPSISYEPQSSTAISTAVPPETASLALSAAIQYHSLPLALAIIDTTYATQSFRRSKMFRRALPPIFAASLAPLAAYSVASTLSAYQTALPPESFTSIAFAGLLTYTTAVGTIGYVALTTSNDQMQRVTWALGMPLWERWIREDERAALDEVVMAWGFKEKWRWGEEEGVEWDGLKEWAGVRGMIVDKVGLMEGME